MKVLVKAPLGPYSGWGQDGIGLCEALTRAGHNVGVLPIEVVPPLPDAVARMLTRPLTPPFDVLVSHVPADRAAVAEWERTATDRLVLWGMWEWTSFANHPGRAAIHEAMWYYDLIAAYDPVSLGAFAEAAPPDVPVVQIQGGFDPGPWQYIKRDWRRPFVYLLAAHVSNRKNVEAALTAFTHLRQRYGNEFDAELWIKAFDRARPLIDSCDKPSPPPPSGVAVLEAAAGTPGVVVHIGTWGREALARLYGRAHCLLAPSRGEGKNLVALEFLATGGPVIATAFGGHQVWLDEAYSYPLRFRLRAATWPIETPDSQEADADIDHLTELMWHVYQYPDEAAAKGRAAADTVPVAYSWDAAVARLWDAISPIAPGKRRKGCGSV